MAGLDTFECGHPRSPENSNLRGDGKGRGICCRICKTKSNKKWREKQPLTRWRAQKLRLRGNRIKPLLEIQEGRCAICRRTMTHPYEDHNHVCCKVNPGCEKCRRGLLCPSCNGGLHLIENEQLHGAAVAYLQKWASMRGVVGED